MLVLSNSKVLQQENNILEKIKEYMYQEHFKIVLHDLIINELKNTLPRLNKALFPLNEPQPNQETILERLNEYEKLTSNLKKIIITFSQWGDNRHLLLFRRILESLSDNIEMDGGKVYWLKLRWYPLFILFYCGGISAIAYENYRYLYSLFLCKLQTNDDDYHEQKFLINLLAKNLTQLDRGAEIFKMLPEHKNDFVPVSEYMFNVVKPILEDVLFLGKSYETLFDKFEIFFSLVYADLNTSGKYGPTGRFVYKYRDRFHGVTKMNLYSQIINEANLKKENWEPLQAGFFCSSYDRFIEVTEGYKKFMESLQWY